MCPSIPMFYAIVIFSVFNIMLWVLYFIKNRMYEHLISFWFGHESSDFQKLAVNKWIYQNKKKKKVTIFFINLVH